MRKLPKETAVETRSEGSAPKQRNLWDIAGTWIADKAVEDALAEQDVVDEELWTSRSSTQAQRNAAVSAVSRRRV
jgi:hypothetical protein